MRVPSKKLYSNNTYSTWLQAAIGIADLCVKAMEADGCTQQQARDSIWMMDIDGLLVKNRPEGNLEGHKVWYAKDYKVMKTLIEVVKEVKPTVLIGKQQLSSNDLGIYNTELKCFTQALRQPQEPSLLKF